MLKMTKRNDDNIDEELAASLETFLSIKDKVWEQQLLARQIVVSGEIKEDLIEKAVIQLMNFNFIDLVGEDDAKKKGEEYSRVPVSILINSDGGLIDEGMALVSCILSSVTPVHTYVLGKAHSVAFLILLAGQERFAYRFSSLMYHQGSGGVIDNFAKINDYNSHAQKTQEKIHRYVMERTKIKEKKLRDVFRTHTDWFMTVDEAEKLGVINQII